MMLSLFISISIFLLLRFITFNEMTRRVIQCIAIVTSYMFITVIGAYNTEIYSSKLLNIALPWNSVFSTVGAMFFPSGFLRGPKEILSHYFRSSRRAERRMLGNCSGADRSGSHSGSIYTRRKKILGELGMPVRVCLVFDLRLFVMVFQVFLNFLSFYCILKS